MIDILQGDITKLSVDAIVNAANAALAGGGGVDGAIHRAAGRKLLEASLALAPCPAGNAVITSGFDLPAKYVIHAVGPVWHGGQRDEDALLERTYESAFARAEETPGIRSIAFPCISTGVYAFPKSRAALIALSVMRRHEARFERIVACVFDTASHALYEAALAELPPGPPVGTG
jgi:O-acetyl-ADP-ribose deacetylase (regulator of RNase III)